MFQIFGYLSGILAVFCYIPYIYDTLIGKTKPQRASWLIWLTLTAIAFFSQLAKGATYSLWLTGIETIGIGIVCVLSIWLGVGGFTRKDIIALFFAGIGLLFWYFSKEAASALYIVIAVDSVGAFLTLQKAYASPESETFSAWILAVASGFAAMLAVGKFNIILLSYPFYIAIANGAIALAMYLGSKKSKRKATSLRKGHRGGHKS